MSPLARPVAVLILIAVVCLVSGATWSADAIRDFPAASLTSATFEGPSDEASWVEESDQEDAETPSPARDGFVLAPRGPVNPIPAERSRRLRPDLPPQLEQLL